MGRNGRRHGCQLVAQFPDVGAELHRDRRVLRLTGGTGGAGRINEFSRLLSGHARPGVQTEDDLLHFGLDFAKRERDDAWAWYESEQGWSAMCEMCSWWFSADDEAGIRAEMRAHDERVHHRPQSV